MVLTTEEVCCVQSVRMAMVLLFIYFDIANMCKLFKSLVKICHFSILFLPTALIFLLQCFNLTSSLDQELMDLIRR